MSALAGLLMGGGMIPAAGIVDASDPAQQGDRLTYGTVVRGHISESISEESWQFDGHVGDWILIDMRAVGSGFDVSLILLGPDGRRLIEDDDGGPGFNARIGPFELPESGEYTILAGHYSGQGDYVLDLHNLRTIPALAPGKPLVGRVDVEHPNDAFALELPEDTPDDTLWQLVISSDHPGANPILALYGTERFINGTEDLPDSSALDPVIPIPGESYVVIVSWNANASGGGYEIALRESALELLTDGASQTGTLDSVTTHHSHYFRAEAGQTVRIAIRTGDEIAPALEIRTVDYTAFLYSNDGEYAREQRLTLAIPVTGVYEIYVRDGSYGGNRGEYALDFEVIGE